jgi:hypothetical protein
MSEVSREYHGIHRVDDGALHRADERSHVDLEEIGA